MANDWVRGLVTPIVVAVIVGLVSGYMASQNALAVHGERLKAVDARIDKIEVRVDGLQEMRVSLARVEAEIANMRAGQARIEAELKARP